MRIGNFNILVGLRLKLHLLLLLNLGIVNSHVFLERFEVYVAVMNAVLLRLIATVAQVSLVTERVSKILWVLLSSTCLLNHVWLLLLLFCRSLGHVQLSTSQCRSSVVVGLWDSSLVIPLLIVTHDSHEILV